MQYLITQPFPGLVLVTCSQVGGFPQEHLSPYWMTESASETGGGAGGSSTFVGISSKYDGLPFLRACRVCMVSII